MKSKAVVKTDNLPVEDRPKKLSLLVQQIQEEFFADNLNVASRKMTKLIHDNPDPKDRTGKILQYKAMEKTLESAGVWHSPNMSVSIQNIFQNNSLVPSPEMMEILREHQQRVAKGVGVIDVEVSDAEEKG